MTAEVNAISETWLRECEVDFNLFQVNHAVIKAHPEKPVYLIIGLSANNPLINRIRKSVIA